jgi:hypothetical protein
MPEKSPLISPPPALGPGDIALLERELSSGAVDYVCTNPRHIAQPLGWHGHPGHEMILIQHGASGDSSEDGAELSLAAGHFLLIPPGVAHRGSMNVREHSLVCAIVLNLSVGRRGWEGCTRDETAWIRASFAAGGPQVRPMLASNPPKPVRGEHPQHFPSAPLIRVPWRTLKHVRRLPSKGVLPFTPIAVVKTQMSEGICRWKQQRAFLASVPPHVRNSSPRCVGFNAALGRLRSSGRRPARATARATSRRSFRCGFVPSNS